MSNNLRTLLAYRNVKVSDVHNATKVSKTTLYNLYHQRTKNPETQTILKIAKYLDVSVDELLGNKKIII